MSICITTGFKDIGRGEWKNFKRSNQEYFKGFSVLSQNCPYHLVAYVEDKYVELLNPKQKGVEILPINDLNLLIHTHNERDWEILNSYEYEVLMQKASNPVTAPERSKKGYNMINASKAGMIANTKKLHPEFDWYAWQDFGDCNLNGGLPFTIDESKLSKDKITVHGKLINPCDYLGLDPVGLARTGDESFLCGAQFIVPSELVEHLEGWMKQAVEDYHSINLTDDDQGLMAIIMNRLPDFFEWVGLGEEWYGLWKHLGVKS